MKKLLIAASLTLGISTGIAQMPAQAKTTTYYQTKLTSASGKNYTVALKSSNVKKKIADDGDMWIGVHIGDHLYRGSFQFYMNGKKTSYKSNVEYNKTRKNFYKVNTKTGTPSFLAISDTQTVNLEYIRLYYVYNGTLRKLNRTFSATIKPKYHAKNIIKIPFYNNVTTKWYIDYYKINPETGGSKYLKTDTVKKRPW